MIAFKVRFFHGGVPIKIGQVFTPLPWARFAAQKGVLDAWLGGNSVLDPTMGTGNLLVALVEAALERGLPLASLPLSNLYGVEIDGGARDQAVERFRSYGVDLSSHFVHGDLFDQLEPRCDVVLANPPWCNFSDLPSSLKPIYKQRFVAWGLVPDASRLLLGKSRIDLAALFVTKIMTDHLMPGGKAWFFLPLSLFLNEGAHAAFRSFRTGSTTFAPCEVYDFGREKVFPGITTRLGLVSFQKDEAPRFPIPYFQLNRSLWAVQEALPLFEPNAPWSVGAPGSLSRPPKIAVSERSRPRQGVNTGGANSVFFFDAVEPAGRLCRAGGCLLPAAYVHPLLSSHQFRNPSAPPERWVLLPHGADGRPLSAEALAAEPELEEYLHRHREALQARKGALLAALQRRGLWWALLGVGSYSFAPHKLVWESAGKKTFRPRLWPGQWQANQALQCYLPFWDAAEAQTALDQLRQPEVEDYLASTQTGGTLSWAQPGRIVRLLEFR